MPQVSRRALLGTGAALVGGVIVGAAAAPAGAAVLPKSLLTKRVALTKPGALSRSNYQRSVGDAFTAVRNGIPHRIVLSRIVNVDGATSKQADSCFNLVFTAAARLPEGIYAISRPGVPAHSLFLGHLGTDTAMQALVNRSR
jgi:hypothetical protein